MPFWAWIAGAGLVGYVAGATKQRMKDSREIIATGPEGQAFAMKLASMQRPLTTMWEGRANDLRTIFALDVPLDGHGGALVTKGYW